LVRLSFNFVFVLAQKLPREKMCADCAGDRRKRCPRALSPGVFALIGAAWLPIQEPGGTKISVFGGQKVVCWPSGSAAAALFLVVALFVALFAAVGPVLFVAVGPPALIQEPGGTKISVFGGQKVVCWPSGSAAIMPGPAKWFFAPRA
jgi:hypothetical protein